MNYCHAGTNIRISGEYLPHVESDDRLFVVLALFSCVSAPSERGRLQAILSEPAGGYVLRKFPPVAFMTPTGALPWILCALRK